MSRTLSKALRPFLLRALTKLLFFCLFIVLFLSTLKGGKKTIDKQKYFLIHFTSIFILLTRRKAMEALVK